MSAGKKEINAKYGLKSFNESIFTNFPEVNNQLSELAKYGRDEITKETAEEYVAMCSKIYTIIDDQDCEEESKEHMKRAITAFVSQLGIAECLKDLVFHCFQEIELLKQSVQEERDSYNDLARKYNEKPKATEVGGVFFQITLRDKTKKLTTDHLLELSDNCRQKRLTEKLTRVSMQGVDLPNVSRVYAKKDKITKAVVK